MGLFDFFKKRKPSDKTTALTGDTKDRSQWTGKDFEFLITGDIDIPAEDYDRIMTPNSFLWQKVERDNWCYYQVEGDEFTYSSEMPGIQMTFNKEISFEKAKQIADEVISNIITSGQKAELIVLDSSNAYRFFDQ